MTVGTAYRYVRILTLSSVWTQIPYIDSVYCLGHKPHILTLSSAGTQTPNIDSV